MQEHHVSRKVNDEISISDRSKWRVCRSLRLAERPHVPTKTRASDTERFEISSYLNNNLYLLIISI